jgi:hypothetical protein
VNWLRRGLRGESYTDTLRFYGVGLAIALPLALLCAVVVNETAALRISLLLAIAVFAILYSAVEWQPWAHYLRFITAIPMAAIPKSYAVVLGGVAAIVLLIWGVAEAVPQIGQINPAIIGADTVLRLVLLAAGILFSGLGFELIEKVASKFQGDAQAIQTTLLKIASAGALYAILGVGIIITVLCFHPTLTVIMPFWLRPM